MNEKRSYIISSFSKNVNTEIKRLEAQVNLFWDEEKKYYSKAIENKKSVILEIGSGPGFLVRKLSASFPENVIHSLEIDPVLVKAQEELIQREKIRNISLYQGSVYDNSLSQNYYDCIIMRLVLEHLPDPLKALNNIYKLLKIDGTLILIDNDFKYHLSSFPFVPELDDLYDAYCQMRITEGGNPYIGRQLPQLMANSGFKEIHLENISAHSSLKGDKLFLSSESSGISTVLVEKGFLAEDTFNSLSRNWKAMLMEDNHILYRPLFLSWGRKADSDPLVVGSSNIEKLNDPEKNVSNYSSLSGNLEEDLNHILQNILSLDLLIKNDESLMNLGLDSINVTELCDVLEKKMGIALSLVKILEADTLKNICDLIRETTKNQSPGDGFEEGEL